MKNLNAVFSKPEMCRRYEVWFLRLGLADGCGAWWFRYLLMNPGRAGCAGKSSGMPVQVWATWFPRDARPQSFIQGFGLEELRLSTRGTSPFHFGIEENKINENSCAGWIEQNGHRVSWDLKYGSNFGVTLSDKGWIGFSRSPHADAVFSGEVVLDGKVFSGEPLGWGVQGHNCGYRHRKQWTWTHAYFPDTGSGASTLEALTYEMPLGLRFRKAVLWHRDRVYVFRKFHEQMRDLEKLQWVFESRDSGGAELGVTVDGTGESLHRAPYLKTDCSGSFEVANNSLARARLVFRYQSSTEELATKDGAVLEMAG